MRLTICLVVLTIFFVNNYAFPGDTDPATKAPEAAEDAAGKAAKEAPKNPAKDAVKDPTKEANKKAKGPHKKHGDAPSKMKDGIEGMEKEGLDALNTGKSEMEKGEKEIGDMAKPLTGLLGGDKKPKGGKKNGKPEDCNDPKKGDDGKQKPDNIVGDMMKDGETIAKDIEKAGEDAMDDMMGMGASLMGGIL